MNALSVPLFLPVEYGVFILWQHLLLRRHLGLPPLQGLERLSLLRERLVEGRNHAVHGAQPSSLPHLLELR